MRKMQALFLVAVLLGLAASGCGTETSPTDAAPQPTSSADTEAPAQTESTDVPVTEEPPTEIPVEETGPMAISSPAFEADGVIPEMYSCMGANVSPALEWTGVPADAESLLLLMYDLDAGAESGASTALGFAHWIVYNIPLSARGFAEDVSAGEDLAGGAAQGSNDFAQFETAGATFPGGGEIKLVGYDGPCPGEEHRYIFELYALDATLDLVGGPMLGEVLAAMEGHVIEQVGVIGSYNPVQ